MELEMTWEMATNKRKQPSESAAKSTQQRFKIQEHLAFYMMAIYIEHVYTLLHTHTRSTHTVPPTCQQPRKTKNEKHKDTANTRRNVKRESPRATDHSASSHGQRNAKPPPLEPSSQFCGSFRAGLQ